MLLNWFRCATSEGNEVCEGTGPPWPPNIPEFDLKRDGGTGWAPPIGVGGPGGTILSLSLPLSQT